MAKRSGTAKREAGLKFSAEATLPTRFGRFRVKAVQEHRKGKEHLVILRGRVRGKRDVPVRLHSECLTGDVMGSLRCDCRDQLERSLRLIEEQGTGVLIYLRQEGRGIGLMNKIRAYSLQEKGYDTVEANQRLGFEDDLRDYDLAVRILKALEIKSVALITNNPEKIAALAKGGVAVSRRIPLVVRPNRFNLRYLQTKRSKLGHLPARKVERPRAASSREGRKV
jgi:GTP cyclohydrolase II